MDGLKDAKVRSRALARRINQRIEQTLRRRIQDYPGDLTYAPLARLMISDCAWDLVVSSGIEPRLVFAHPDILSAHPDTSQYYRGLTLLSRKRVSELATQVDKWEDGSRGVAPSAESCMKVSRLYNAVLCSIIEETSDWSLEHGYRNIVATIGIGLDGSFRNWIGQDAEERVKARIVEWLRRHKIIAQELGEIVYALPKQTTMRFGTDPDIEFLRNGEQIATVEIKGGKDPAGALERLGAMQKSFAETPPGCVNFLVAGVVTPEMEHRLNQIGSVKVYWLDEIIENEDQWDAFARESFHYALRIV